MKAPHTSRTMRQDIPGTVERPPARHNMTIEEAETLRLLHDPIDFAQNIGRVLEQGELQAVLMADVPTQVEEARNRFASLLELAVERGERSAIQDVMGRYTDFVIQALGEAREYGVAWGAVLEQLRVGLLEIHDLKQRGMTYSDAMTAKTTSELRRKHNLLPSDQALDDYSDITSPPERPGESHHAAD